MVQQDQQRNRSIVSDIFLTTGSKQIVHTIRVCADVRTKSIREFYKLITYRYINGSILHGLEPTADLSNSSLYGELIVSAVEAAMIMLKTGLESISFRKSLRFTIARLTVYDILLFLTLDRIIPVLLYS